MGRDQRRFPRVNVGFPVKLYGANGEYDGRLKNVSLRGTLVTTEVPLSPGERYVVVVDLGAPADPSQTPKPITIEFTAEIIRVESEPDAGGMFITNIKPEDLNELKSLIQHERERTAVRCEVYFKRDLSAAARKKLGTLLLAWRGEQAQGIVQRFDTKTTHELQAGSIPTADAVTFAIYESAYNREQLCRSLRAKIPAEFVSEVTVDGFTWD